MSLIFGRAACSGSPASLWRSLLARSFAKPDTGGRRRRSLAMRPIYILIACLLLSGAVRAQAGGTNPDSSASDANLAAEIKSLREALVQTQKQMAAQQREIEALKAQSKNSESGAATSESPANRANEAVGNSAAPGVEPGTVTPSANIQPQQATQQGQPQGNQQQEPLGSFKFGDAILELGGFVDLENIYRTTNTQSNIATNLGGFPYNNTPQGNVSEFRTTAQFSRLSFKVQDSFKGNDITGFVEGDFSGNDTPGVYQSVNPHTN